MENPCTSPVEAPETGYPSLAVDIQKEEFVEFSLLQAKVNGVLRRKKLMIPLSLLLFVMLTALIVWDYIELGRLDVVSVVVALFTLSPVAVFSFILPAVLKKKAEKAYLRRQKQLPDGLYGTLTVYPDRIEKVGSFSTAKICLNAHSLFIEREDMLLLLNRVSPALVLPARCMTPEMTALVRAAADKLPTTNRVFISRFVPRSEPVAQPVARPDEEVLWAQMVVYTPDESFRIGRQLLIQRYWKSAPGLAALSLLGAYLIAWNGSGNVISLALYFLVLMGAQTLLTLVLPMSRMRKMSTLQETRDLTAHFRITRQAVYFRHADAADLGIFWDDILHVYDKEDMVEVEVRGGGGFQIPKRFIADFKEFSEIIDLCRKK